MLGLPQAAPAHSRTGRGHPPGRVLVTCLASRSSPLHTCNGTDAQQWEQNSSGELVNPQSGLCLTDPSDGATNSTQLESAACSDAAGQVWTLPPVVGVISADVADVVLGEVRCVSCHGAVAGVVMENCQAMVCCGACQDDEGDEHSHRDSRRRGGPSGSGAFGGADGVRTGGGMNAGRAWHRLELGSA